MKKSLIILVIIFVLLIAVVLYPVYGEYFKNDNTSKDEQNFKNSIGNLSYNVPKNFIDDELGIKNTDQYYILNETDNCSFYVSVYDTNDDKFKDKAAREHILDISFKTATILRGNFTEKTTKKINGKKWEYIRIDTKYLDKHYYVIIHKNQLYEIEFTINEDNSGICTNGYNSFVDSLKLK